MAWVAPRTYVAAAVLTAAQLNETRDSLKYLYGGTGSGEKGSFAARQNAVTSITNGVDTTVIFQTEDRDNESAYNNATGVWTCAVTGLYLFTATVAFASNATGVRGVLILQSNGLFARNWVTAATDSTGHCSASVIFLVTAPATVQVKAYQSSGGALNTQGGNDCTFSGVWVGN